MKLLLSLLVTTTAIAANSAGLDNLNEVINVRNKRCVADLTCDGLPLSTRHRQLFLNAHNSARDSLANGLAGNKCGLLPQAANMYKLKWNCSLEAAAQSWAEDCSNSYALRVQNRGQAFTYVPFVTANDDPTPHIVETLTDWWSQINNVGIEEDLIYNDAINAHAWANMASGKATEIGCAINNCNGQLAITCFYDQQGSTDGAPVYEIGLGCAYDTDCTLSPNSHCIAGEKLCYIDENASQEKETSNICPENPHVSDLLRTTVVDWHNALRSRLARGLEVDGQGHYAPRGSSILKIQYDCGLERTAYEAARLCLYSQTKAGRGENVYMVSSEEIGNDPVVLLEKAMTSWWSPLQNIGMGYNISYSMAVARSQLNTYTQMAWGETFRLGCATRVCMDKELAICHYAPSGNKYNVPVYDMGDPCMYDAMCDRGETCQKELGLCVVDVQEPAVKMDK